MRGRFPRLPYAERTAPGPGQTIWLGGGAQRRLENLDDAPLELLRLDFRTGPAPAREGRDDDD